MDNMEADVKKSVPSLESWCPINKVPNLYFSASLRGCGSFIMDVLGIKHRIKKLS